MTPGLDQVFEGRIVQFDDYAATLREDDPQSSLSALSRLLEDWREANPDVLRSDGAFFLLANADALIASPLIEAGAPANEVGEALLDDMGLILDRVKSLGEEVSAHRVLQIVSETWGSLRLTSSAWWD